MAKRKAIAAAIGSEVVTPKSFVELWNWCREYAAELTRPPQHESQTNPDPDTGRIKEALDAHYAVARSDRNREPAFRFHAEFVSHLTRLGYRKANLFCLKTYVDAPYSVTIPVPPEAEFFDLQSATNVRRARWTDQKGGQQASEVTAGDDGIEYVIEQTTVQVECLRLDELVRCAQSLCRRLMVDNLELPACWKDSLPGGPLRTPSDVFSVWVAPKLDLLKQMAGTLDGDEPIVNAEEFKAAADNYLQSTSYTQFQKTGLIDKNDPVVINFDAAMKPLDEFMRSEDFWAGLLARQKGAVERILREVIRGVELWLDARSHVQGRPAKLRSVDGADEELLRAHVLELQKYLTELANSDNPRFPSPPGNEAGGEHDNIDHQSEKLRPCASKAWTQYQIAIKSEAELKTDQEAYRWYIDNFADDDETLPEFATWVRYVREARAAKGKQKNRRGGAVETRSVVKSKSKNRTKADRI